MMLMAGTTGGRRQRPAELDLVTLATHLERVVSLIRRLSPPGMSLTTASTMRALEQDGPSRLSDLAAREGVTQPAMTQLVTRLERDGYAERGGDPDDARVVRVRLTPRGANVLRERRETRARQLGDMLARLSTDEIEAIAAAMPALDRLIAMEHPTKTPGDVQ
jgi:DNA-binding MarR family transcriptional regulator